MTTAIDASAQFVRAADRLPTLYALSDTYNELVALLEDPAANQDDIERELAAVAGDIKAKAYGLAIVIQTFETRAILMRGEEQRLAAKRKASEAHADRLRAYALAQMQAMGTERIDTGTFTYQVRTNPPSVVVQDAGAVGSEFQRTRIITEVDKRAVLDHYRTTGEIPAGVEITRTTRLEIG